MCGRRKSSEYLSCPSSQAKGEGSCYTLNIKRQKHSPNLKTNIMPSLTQIAEEILANAKRLDAYTSSKALPSTSFELDTLGDLPPDVEKARHVPINSTQDLNRLALRPMNTLIEIMFGVYHPFRPKEPATNPIPP